MKSPKDTFAEAIRLLDKGNIDQAGDLIIELGPFFTQQMRKHSSVYLIVPNPSHPDQQFLMHDEGYGPYLVGEPHTIDWGEVTPGHYVCKDCGHGRPVTIVPPLGWVMCDTYWLCPLCADKRSQRDG